MIKVVNKIAIKRYGILLGQLLAPSAEGKTLLLWIWVFSLNRPLGRFSLKVAMSVCVCVFGINVAGTGKKTI